MEAEAEAEEAADGALVAGAAAEAADVAIGSAVARDVRSLLSGLCNGSWHAGVERERFGKR